MNALARIMPVFPAFPAYYTVLDKAGWWALRAVCIGVLVYLLLPILVVIPLSFSESSFLSYPIPGWSLKWYRNLFSSDDWARAAKNSFIVAPAATVAFEAAKPAFAITRMSATMFMDLPASG